RGCSRASRGRWWPPAWICLTSGSSGACGKAWRCAWPRAQTGAYTAELRPPKSRAGSVVASGDAEALPAGPAPLDEVRVLLCLGGPRDKRRRAKVRREDGEAAAPRRRGESAGAELAGSSPPCRGG